jgi:CHAT domain
MHGRREPLMDARLDDFISGQRQVVAGLSAADHQYARELAVLAEFLTVRYQDRRNGDDLMEAIGFGRAAVAATPDGDEDRAERLANLGMQLRLEYARTQELGYLDEAIAAGRAAVQAASPGADGLSVMFSRLGIALRLRFEHAGLTADLDECVSASRSAVRAATSAEAGASARNALCLALEARYERSSAIADLDEAVSVARDGVGIAADDAPNRGIFLGTLAGAYYLRFKAGGEAEDLRQAIGTWREALSVMPAGHPGRQSFIHNLRQAEQRLGDEATTLVVGPPFPGAYGALGAEVMAQNLDVWQAEEVARTRPPGSARHLLEMASLARAASSMDAGDWDARIVFLRLLVAAFEGTADDADPTGARASVNTDFTISAGTALSIGADPELFAVALAAGQWALDWSRRHEDAAAEHAALGALALLHTVPYTATLRPATYGVDHVRWKRSTRARAVNLTAVMTTHTLADDGELIPVDPPLTMPEPLAALQEAERYTRAAIDVADSGRRDHDTGSLVAILDWEARLGGEVDQAELAALRAQVPAAAASPPALGHLDKIAAEFARLATSRAPGPALDALLGRISPQMAIAALWIALENSRDLSPEAVATLISVQALLANSHGDEGDRTDQLNLEIRLLPRIHAADFTGGPAAGAEIPDAAALIRRLQSGRKRTATARGAWLMLLADRCADTPQAAALGIEALASAGRLAPSLFEQHGQARLFIEGKLHFGLAAQALVGEHAAEAATAFASAAPRFAFLGLPSRVGDCLAVLDELSLNLEVSAWPPVLAGIRGVLQFAPDLDQNANKLVKLTLTQMLGASRGSSIELDWVLQLFQLASGFQTSAVLSRVPPPAELDETGLDVLGSVGLAEGAAGQDAGLPASGTDFLDNETVIVSWSDALHRRPSNSPAQRLRNRQRRFDRYLATLLATGDGVFPDPLQLEDIQSILDDRTVLIIYFTGAWSRDEEGTAFLVITRDDVHVEMRVESEERAGDLYLREGDITAVTSRHGLFVADLRRKIQSDPMTGHVSPDAAQILADGSEMFLGDFRPRLADLRSAGKDRLWIVPHGPLHYYPFHLVGPEGDPLAASWTVTYLPSLALLRPRAAANPPVPARPSAITSFGLAYQGAGLTGLPPLARAAQEAQAVAALFGGQAVPEAMATKTAVLSALRDSRYVHLAAHGAHNADAPAFHSIYLSGTGTESVLFAHDILRQDLRGLELVTLSACETALGRFDRLDNLQGLPAALLQAGAGAIIGTLWPVSDEAAALFFPALYQALARRQDVFDAFRNAQATVSAALPQYWDWGAFYLMGGQAR